MCRAAKRAPRSLFNYVAIIVVSRRERACVETSMVVRKSDVRLLLVGFVGLYLLMYGSIVVRKSKKMFILI